MFQKKQIEEDLRKQIAKELIEWAAVNYNSMIDEEALSIIRGETDLSLQEQIAREIERDKFWESPEFNGEQQRVVLAMRMRMANLVRNYRGRP